ncbi:Alpha/Beta hydrolase protein [Dactylonectria macrodidyma]|uniref:Alpha/Beta hydrolase protein n=1 Tax=Dactylonectria macrodidyma TaxID=307937 RepID=A0A9P9FSM4_9HYPO|nr:Alpha/Beta hydrolase protein [Dactylonectria macrodidyma]
MVDASPTSFGSVHVLEPTTTHTHTAILLHGRGSTGEEFAQELTESPMSDKRTLMQALPSWRWVFPSSRELWSTVFEEDMPAWFEAHSLTNVTARQDLQIEGIRESVRYLEAILESEIEKVSGLATNVVLGGISQGAAIGMWTMLCANTKTPPRRLGAFVGASTWLPFAANIDKVLCGNHESQHTEGDRFVESMMPPQNRTQPPISVFLGHGTDDAYVDVELGRQVRQVLSRAGMDVEWKEYSGADQEGHWLKAPEEVDDIAHFLQNMAET